MSVASEACIEPASIAPAERDTDIESTFVSGTSYAAFSHHRLAQRLRQAVATRQLGSARPDTALPSSVAHAVLFTLPWRILLPQSLWSGAVTAAAWALGNDSFTTLSTEFWRSRVVVPSSVVHGVGWALFVLLGFFIREAANRHREAAIALDKIAGLLPQTVRQLKHAYHGISWHHGDRDRIIAHLVAYPLALKMELRGERDIDQVRGVLCDDDAKELLEADFMHLHCMRVVRAYFAVAEHNEAKKVTHAGLDTRYLVMELPDAIDMEAFVLFRIKDFKPAKGYTSHLKVFLAIWLFFLPLALVRSSGWFSVLWALLISYGISMLFTTAVALNGPFGFDPHDLQLTVLCSNVSISVLDTFSKARLELEQVVRADRETPPWLERELPTNSSKHRKRKSPLKAVAWGVFISLKDSLTKRSVFLPLLIFGIWVTFLVFVSWGISRHKQFDSACRWWCIYVPVDSETTAYIGLAVFLLLGFWLLDAYDRYWRAVQIWQSQIRTGLETLALNFSMTCKQGLWHRRDRERIFAHLTAIPYAAKLDFRGVRDTKEIEAILSAEDCAAMKEASFLSNHCFDVLYGYFHSAEIERRKDDGELAPLSLTMCSIERTLWEVEFMSWGACLMIREHPLPPSFTLHLWVFTSIWLAILPVALFQNYGFLSFLFLLPIAYSVINLISLGRELENPFEAADEHGENPFEAESEHGVPLDTLCDEIRDSIHNIYHTSKRKSSELVTESDYQHTSFRPKFWNFEHLLQSETEDFWSSGQRNSVLTFQRSFRSFTGSLPSVPWQAQVLISMWSIFAVFLSYGLSFTWDSSRRGDCKRWCSPIDVDGGVLLETGFALFLILAFRASDAIQRFEDGAMLIYDMDMQLRALAVEFVQAFGHDSWHKLRIIAHLVQLPLEFRDALLETENSRDGGVLSAADKQDLTNSKCHTQHCLQVLETYVLTAKTTDPENSSMKSDFQSPFLCTHAMLWRLSQLRHLIGKAFSMKRFPVIRSYTRHQRLFIALWLVLLPLGMTPDTGFYTILWAPLISYAVLGLEEIAARLRNPFGVHTKLDLPVKEMCKEAARLVLQATHSSGWTADYHLQGAENKRFSNELGQNSKEADLIQSDCIDTCDFAGSKLLLPGTRQQMDAPSLYAHMTRSVPWWVLFGTVIWTILAVVLSYVSRTGRPGRWWETTITVDGKVGSYVSIPAFTLLGFYANTAFSRYHEAGSVWGDNLRASCHALSAQLLTRFSPGTWHRDDLKRLIAHIASVPIALKMETRGHRNVSELRGLLPLDDIGKMHCAESMTSHCVDVIRSYFYSAADHEDGVHNWNNRMAFIKVEITSLERAIRSCLFLKQFEIAPGFMMLLRTLLGIWFLLLPFILAESSGWFAILWVFFIAYGILGMYAIAREIQQPYQDDLNDLNLDIWADEIVQGVLDVYHNYEKGRYTLIENPGFPASVWQLEQDDNSSPTIVGTSETPETLLAMDEKKEIATGRWRLLRLAKGSLAWWMLPSVAVWSTLCVVASWLVSRHFPLDSSVDCSPSWCSAIAIDASVSEYVGFALFLLLGFRLYDSHWRYVTGLTIWREGIIGTTRLLSNRLFSCYAAGTWHEADMERIAAHLTAFSVVTAARLRQETSCAEKLGAIMHPSDVTAVEGMAEKGDYCLDVVRTYLVAEENARLEAGRELRVGRNEHWMVFHYLNVLKDHAAKCERMIRIPLPFGYVEHIRIFMLIWLMLLPLGLVESTGFFTILWVVVIAFGVTGVEHWATELSDPFGLDASDLCLGSMRKEVFEAVKTNLNVFRDGPKALIKERPGLS